MSPSVSSIGAPVVHDPLELSSQALHVFLAQVHTERRCEPLSFDCLLKACGRGAHVGSSAIRFPCRVHDDLTVRCSHYPDEIALVRFLSTCDTGAKRYLARLHYSAESSFSCTPQYLLPGRAWLRQRIPVLVTATQRPSPSSAVVSSPETAVAIPALTA